MTDHYDVAVLGTGAAGLVAALAAASAGASVGLFERAASVGGTTALSGGVLWLPANRLGAQAGVGDSREAALGYLHALSNESMREEMVTAFVDGVDGLLDWVEQETPLRLRLVAGYPDYHPEHPGGLPEGGRSLEPELFGAARLGEWAQRIVGEPRPFCISELPSGGGTGVLPEHVLHERGLAHLEGLGRGLVASLLAGCLERDVEPQVEHRAVELHLRDGRVTGVGFDTAAGRRDVTADSVVLAAGGFEWNSALAGDFLRGPVRFPPGVATNTGDGLLMAMRAGARLGGMPNAWWVPVVTPPGRRAIDDEQQSTLLLRERTLPGTIMVNRDGERFANEAANYNALGTVFHAFDATRFRYANLPAWLVLDSRCVERYGVFGTAPGQPAPGWLIRADTLADLARALDVPAESLAATVARWNDGVDRGRDDQFHRGESVYDGWCGDREHYRTPQATLGAVSKPPFFATAVHPSTLGTNGGPVTTADGEVLRADGVPLPGLYAAGNAMAAATGMAYGGAGGTLGPAMVFALRAGRHAAAARARA